MPTRTPPTGRLNQPQLRRRHVRRHAGHTDAFGRFAEAFARYMGTAQFIIGMTMLIVAWICWNTLAPNSWRFDRPWFVLLNLLFSTQASYAAPLILLAQNRQDTRDRAALTHDRLRDERNLAATEYLTREVATIRNGLSRIATRDYIRSELTPTRDELHQLQETLAEVSHQLTLLGRATDGPATAGWQPARQERSFPSTKTTR